MNTDLSERIHERAYSETIVDTDFHLQLSPDEVMPYVTDDLVRKKAEDGGWPGYSDQWEIGYAVESRNAVEYHGKATTADEIATVRRQFGLDYVIAVPGSSFFSLPSARYRVMKNALVRAYNEYVLDQVVDADRGIYATLLLPQWDPEACLDELDRFASEPGFCGAQGFYGPHTLLGGDQFDDVLSGLADHDLPLALHPGGTGQQFNDDRGERGSFLEGMIVEWPHYAMANVCQFVFSGVFDEYPDFGLVIQEAGTYWVPLVAHRSDELYINYPGEIELYPRMFEAGRRKLERMPSEYVFDNVYASTQPVALSDREMEVESMLTSCRATETFMFSTDFPHQTIDTPDWLYERKSLSAADRERILSGNALDVFDFRNT